MNQRYGCQVTRLEPRISNFVLNQIRSVAFESISKTTEPIANFATVRVAVHVVFAVQIHYSQNFFYMKRDMKFAASACLLREIQIICRVSYFWYKQLIDEDDAKI